MKDIIMLAASVILGIAIFEMIAGADDNSLYSATGRLWEKQKEIRTMQDY